jgi:hypothetical protein
MTTHQPIMLSLERSLLEHPEALHLRRMRMALWLYLVLLARLPHGQNSFDVNPAALALSMGLPEGTVRSWLGHLRKGRYITIEGQNGSLRITIKHATKEPDSPSREPLRQLFSVPRLMRALGEKQDPDALAQALARYPTDIIRQSLARTLAVPNEKIRRSRTALFLYLLTHHNETR